MSLVKAVKMWPGNMYVENFGNHYGKITANMFEFHFTPHNSSGFASIFNFFYIILVVHNAFYPTISFIV